MFIDALQIGSSCPADQISLLCRPGLFALKIASTLIEDAAFMPLTSGIHALYISAECLEDRGLHVMDIGPLLFDYQVSMP